MAGGGPVGQVAANPFGPQQQPSTPMGGGTSPLNTGGSMTAQPAVMAEPQVVNPSFHINYGQGNGGGFGGQQPISGGFAVFDGQQQQPNTGSGPMVALPDSDNSVVANFGDMQNRPQVEPQFNPYQRQSRGYAPLEAEKAFYDMQAQRRQQRQQFNPYQQQNPYQRAAMYGLEGSPPYQDRFQRQNPYQQPMYADRGYRPVQQSRTSYAQQLAAQQAQQQRYGRQMGFQGYRNPYQQRQPFMSQPQPQRPQYNPVAPAPQPRMSMDMPQTYNQGLQDLIPLLNAGQNIGAERKYDTPQPVITPAPAPAPAPAPETVAAPAPSPVDYYWLNTWKNGGRV